MTSISIHLDNDHILLDSGISSDISGIFAIRCHGSKTVHQPMIRLLGETYLQDENSIMIDTFMDKNYHFLNDNQRQATKSASSFATNSFTADNYATIILPFSISIDSDCPVSLSSSRFSIRYTISATVRPVTTVNKRIHTALPIYVHHSYVPLPSKLYWGTSKRTQQWRYEVQLSNIVTTTAARAEDGHCIIHAALRITNALKQQPGQPLEDKPKHKEACLAEFKVMEEYTACNNRSTTTVPVLSESYTLSWPSYTWDYPWKINLKLDRILLPTVPYKSSHGISVRHWLQLKLSFNNGNGYVDYGNHRFSLRVDEIPPIPLESPSATMLHNSTGSGTCLVYSSSGETS